MGRGRKPLPKAILKLRNSSELRRRRHKNTEPEAPDGCPGCPSWLDTEGKREWKRTTAALASMGILSSADRAVIAGLCQNWSVFVRASRELNAMDGLGRDARATVATCSDSYKNYLRACEQFGLTPSARTRIDTDIGGKKLDAFDQFVQRKRG